MKVFSWNINSVRLRAPIILKLIEEQSPDVICLQETKCPDEAFPFKTFEKAGYSHFAVNGMKSYNGLAILSRYPIESIQIHHRVDKQDCRHLSAIIQGVEIHNLYIPAGGDEPDTTINEKFKHKLDFVDEMTTWFAQHKNNNQPIIALGDFNIAPHEHDVWSSKQLKDVVSHTPLEREKLIKLQQSISFIDVARHFIPLTEKAYSWWSYRNKDWKISNRGRRLDHIWVTPVLKDKLKSYNVITHARDWEKPSDHAPIMVEISA